MNIFFRYFLVFLLFSLPSFTFSYFWYIWNNFDNSSIPPKIEYKSETWFFGNEFKYASNPWENLNITPVWFLQNYIWEKLVFPKKVELTQEENSWWGDSFVSNYCEGPEKLYEADISIKNNWYKDYISLEWEKSDDHIKIIKTSPNYKEISLDKNLGFFEDFSIESEKTYSYFVYSYNSCSSEYSNLLSIKYNSKKDSLAYISLLEDKLFVWNTDTIKTDYLKLECFLYSKEIVSTNLSKNSFYRIDKSYLNKPFYCYWRYIDNSWNLVSSDIFLNNFSKSGYIKNKEALEFFYSWDIYSIYYLFPKIDIEENLDYGNLALFAINKKLWYPFFDKSLAFSIFVDIWIFQNDYDIDKEVNFKDFLDVYNYIEKEDFLEMLNKSLEKSFSLNKESFERDFREIENISSKLQYLKEKYHKNYLEISSCINYLWCETPYLYLDFFKTIDVIGSTNKYDYEIITYKDLYQEIIKFYVLNSPYSKDYSENELYIFSDIIFQVISKDELFFDQKVDYLNYLKIKVYLINSSFPQNLDYLIKNHLKNINKLYKNIGLNDNFNIIVKTFLKNNN